MSALTVEEFNRIGYGRLPGHLGFVVTEVAEGRVCAQMAIAPYHMAPNGYLHAATVITLADTAAGYGCRTVMPPGASGFTTIELKANYLGTARDGVIECVATVVHRGNATQVWDSIVTHKETGKTIALFRCTQMVLYPKK